MSKTAERRATFIASTVAMVKEHDFDGLDLDWEYPGGRSDSPGAPEDKANFASLLRYTILAFPYDNVQFQGFCIPLVSTYSTQVRGED